MSRIVVCVAVLIAAGCSRAPVPQTSEIQAISDGPSTPTSALPPAHWQPSDWPGWRGPQQDGIAEGPAVPTTWDDTTNVVWKAKVPGRGHASPVIVGDQIFLATADEAKQTQSVLAVNRTNGKWIWQTTIFEGNLEPEMHRENSQASSTPATDGDRLFVTFLNDRRIWCSALTLNGEELWRQEVGGFQSKFGYSASPVVYGGLVILAADHAAGGFIAGLDRGTGNIVWRRKRPANSSYASPRVVKLAGQDQLVICGCGRVQAYDPLTGKDLWDIAGTTEATVGTPVISQQFVMVSGGYPGAETIAVDGTGKVGWRIRDKCYVPSLLAVGSLLFLMQDDGVLKCVDTATGKEHWKQRVGGKFRTSPVVSGENVFVTDMAGKTTVFRATDKAFESVGENQSGTECFASPAISQGQLFLRVADESSGPRQEWLYCVAAKSPIP